MSIIQIFNREKAEYNKFDKINRLHRDANIDSIMAYSIFFPVVEILSSLALALIVWWGGKGVLEGQTTIGQLMSFIMFLNMMFRPIRQLADRSSGGPSDHFPGRDGSTRRKIRRRTRSTAGDGETRCTVRCNCDQPRRIGPRTGDSHAIE